MKHTVVKLSVSFLAFVFCLLFLFSIHSGSSAGIYPAAAVVDDITGDVVTVRDYNGFLWTFSGAEDYAVGDLVSIIFSDNNTISIFDDEILQVRYCGVLEVS